MLQGLGKTVQTIAFLAAVLGKTGDVRRDSRAPGSSAVPGANQCVR